MKSKEKIKCDFIYHEGWTEDFLKTGLNKSNEKKYIATRQAFIDGHQNKYSKYCAKELNNGYLTDKEEKYVKLKYLQSKYIIKELFDLLRILSYLKR